jgi:hypothetical protein
MAPRDIFTEPDVDPDTLGNLGPLAAMAGTFEGDGGIDEHPVAEGTEVAAYIERYELTPIDGQTNGPQLYYGLRYHRHIVQPGQVETFHDQVGYWLWEPASGAIVLSLALPRGQVALLGGTATAGARSFELVAREGDPTFGISSNPFLLEAYRTTEVRVQVTIEGDGVWSYDEVTVLGVEGWAEPFHHRDRNTLTRVAEPARNPTARAAVGIEPRGAAAVDGASLGIGALSAADELGPVPMPWLGAPSPARLRPETQPEAPTADVES